LIWGRVDLPAHRLGRRVEDRPAVSRTSAGESRRVSLPRGPRASGRSGRGGSGECCRRDKCADASHWITLRSSSDAVLASELALGVDMRSIYDAS